MPSFIFWKLVWGVLFHVAIISWRELQQLQVPFTFPLSAALILNQRYAQLVPHVLQMNWNKSGICPTVREKKWRGEKKTVYKIFHASPTSLVLPYFWHRNLIVFCSDILGCLSGFHSSFLTWLWVSQETANFAAQWKLSTAIQTQRTLVGRKSTWPQSGDILMSFLQGLAEGFESGKLSQCVRKKMKGLSRSQPEKKQKGWKRV